MLGDCSKALNVSRNFASIRGTKKGKKFVRYFVEMRDHSNWVCSILAVLCDNNQLGMKMKEVDVGS